MCKVELNNEGEFAIITASLSAANQNEWIKHIKARLAEKYPDLKLAAIQPSEGDRDRAFAETQTVMKVYPNMKLIMAGELKRGDREIGAGPLDNQSAGSRSVIRRSIRIQQSQY